MSRPRRKPGFITIHPEGVALLDERGVGPAAAWFLVRLLILTDSRTAEVRGSRRFLAEETGVNHQTMRHYFRELVAADIIAVQAGANQYVETVITIVEWDTLVGIAVSGGVSDSESAVSNNGSAVSNNGSAVSGGVSDLTTAQARIPIQKKKKDRRTEGQKNRGGTASAARRPGESEDTANPCPGCDKVGALLIGDNTARCTNCDWRWAG